MAQASTPIELESAGDDPWGHGATLLAMARDLGIGDRVRVLPMASPDEMVRLAAAYDLGLSLETDVSENRRLCLTNKIFTYLLAGVPVVMSDTPAQRAARARSRRGGGSGAACPIRQAIAVGARSPCGRLDAPRSATPGRERYNWESRRRAAPSVGPRSRAARGLRTDRASADPCSSRGKVG